MTGHTVCCIAVTERYRSYLKHSFPNRESEFPNRQRSDSRRHRHLHYRGRNIFHCLHVFVLSETNIESSSRTSSLLWKVSLYPVLEINLFRRRFLGYRYFQIYMYVVDFLGQTLRQPKRKKQ